MAATRLSPQHPSEKLSVVDALGAALWASHLPATRDIRSGLVTVDGAVVRDPYHVVDLKRDTVEVQGISISEEHQGPLHILMHAESRRPSQLWSDLHHTAHVDDGTGVLTGIALYDVYRSEPERLRHTEWMLTRDYVLMVRPALTHQQLSHLRVAIASAALMEAQDVQILPTMDGAQGRYIIPATFVEFDVIEHALEESRIRLVGATSTRHGPFRASDLEPDSWRRLTPDEAASVEALVTSGLHDDVDVDQIWEAIARGASSPGGY